MSIDTIFKSALAIAGAAAGYFFGEFDGFFYAIITFVVIDYITGILSAIIKKQLSSGIGFKGIFRKVCIFIMIGIAHIIDTNVLKENGVLRTMVIFFYIANEGISIIENAAFLGLPIPAKLVSSLLQLKKKYEDKENGQENNKE